jgi:hypothetical protein
VNNAVMSLNAVNLKGELLEAYLGQQWSYHEGIIPVADTSAQQI